MKFSKSGLAKMAGPASLSVLICGLASQVQAQAVSSSRVQPLSGNPNGVIDFANAKPMPLPRIDKAPAPGAPRAPSAAKKSSVGVVPGSDSGDGQTSPIQLAPAKSSLKAVTPSLGVTQANGVTSQANGQAAPYHPYTIAQASALKDKTQNSFPYRAAGKLFFLDNGQTFVCSASLIKSGLLVTAAHCVANFGTGQYYSDWVYVPAYDNGKAPYGKWKGVQAFALPSYVNGSDSCATPGVVCENDVAVITLYKGRSLPGKRTGWLGYAYGGFGVNPSGQAHITQLGYPVGLDKGAVMERGDSQSYIDPANSNNTIIGSNMDGGSSGGPWILNFGIGPTFTGEDAGVDPDPNTVVGVTSWGYTVTSPKEQGASPFTSNNIVNLVNAACAASPLVC
ncbi:conserved hypothetical protein [Methylocella silvestris BL2]|uniref:Peptidase S1 domain-containing protein n=1 Tax=Methylocella silvestris (strain DSM 15510 / CIP 108128 / LMG 27833 / NCIMB 13906 / BL2) TaxID=395965 RepID=B8ERD1_METSB|nr:trypsin-like serine protease [Methylocella silvestris]ACK50315.1 conserved hypothetical protein [Methylocella silvestris BL2]